MKKNTRITLGLTLVTALLTTSYFFWFPSLPIVSGQEFTTARTSLLKNGWKPVETANKYANGEFIRASGEAGGLYKAGYIEVAHCSGTGRNGCIFFYEKSFGRCLKLNTAGMFRAENNISPVVENWMFECAGSEL